MESRVSKKKAQKTVTITFDVHYFLQTKDETIACITGDEQQVLKDYGLISEK